MGLGVAHGGDGGGGGAEEEGLGRPAQRQEGQGKENGLRGVGEFERAYALGVGDEERRNPTADAEADGGGVDGGGGDEGECPDAGVEDDGGVRDG